MAAPGQTRRTPANMNDATPRLGGAGVGHGSKEETASRVTFVREAHSFYGDLRSARGDAAGLRRGRRAKAAF